MWILIIAFTVSEGPYGPPGSTTGGITSIEFSNEAACAAALHKLPRSIYSGPLEIGSGSFCIAKD
jgi:hypothetical protein